MHYTRWRRYGEASISTNPAKRKPSTEERLFAKVDKSGGPDACWPWMGKTRLPRGYGFMSVNNRHTLTHRIAYEVTYGPIPEGVHIMHSCDNPPCCNPKHLIPGNALLNIRDAAIKGHMHGWQRPRGEASGKAKLTEAKVRTIRSLFSQGQTKTAIAAQLGIGVTTVHNIVNGLTWKHVQ